MSNDMYSVEQVADLLGLHVRTVRGYIRSGRLRATRIGKQYRIARADLDALTGRPTAAARRRGRRCPASFASTASTGPPPTGSPRWCSPA
ncbi:helix-turn-helix domain-containing protein [Micromonospora sp. BRA006-A]|nr:helix-turn-helix domain-containing protein [Micromonospora sp. BRA006-A]